MLKNIVLGWAPWLTTVIPATWEAEIEKIMVQVQLWQKICESPSQQTN
jgi:hypothetical protein